MDNQEVLGFYNLKDEERAWVELFGISNGESVAGHSWNVAFLTLLFSREKDVDTSKALKMSIIHDLAEAETGDIISRAKDSRREITEEEKHEMERNFWDKTGNKENFGDLHELWEEYEDRETVESKIVKDMDLLDLCLQATRYQEEGRYDTEKVEDLPEDFLDEVFSNSRQKLQTQLGRQKFHQIKSRYEKAKEGREINWEDEKLELAYRALALKDEGRTGWELRGVEDPETVAAHSWGSPLQVLLHMEKLDVDDLKVLKMALVHDLEQVETGDIPSRGDEEQKLMSTGDKNRKEAASMKKLIPQSLQEIFELWEEHMEMESIEARFVEDVEQIDMILQALKYEMEERYDPDENPDFSTYERMDEFFVSADENIETETGRKLFKKIKAEYSKVKTE